MNNPTVTCQDERRRHKARAADFNGLDYLEVSADQRKLTVYFLGKAPEGITRKNVRITGGRRIRDVRVVDVRLCRQDDPERDDCMIVTVDRPGDFSTYELCLLGLGEEVRIDPRYACLAFSFKVGCPSDLDCKPRAICPPERLPEPEIDYLAKDYASFRRLILDRLALIMPDWRERHVPDIGIALVELLAYVGDQLSYYQDAVATEAYLDTARRRISVRRHARLVDYPVHEGCNARAWVVVGAGGDLSLDPDDVYFITGTGLPVDGTLLTPDDLRNIPASRYEVFEPLVEPLGSPRLRLRDLKDPACLAAKLRDAQDPVSRHLRGLLSERTGELLEEHPGVGPPSEDLREALIGDLDRLVQGASLYDEGRFEHVALTEEVSRLIRQDPQGEALVRLNRALLEAAYPQEIATSRKPGDPIRFYKAHREIPFYTWGDRRCCLPRGATSATLKDEWVLVEGTRPGERETGRGAYEGMVQAQPPEERPPPGPSACGMTRKLHLQPGAPLVFEEVIGPETGNEADADPARRHVVRLTRVTLDVDPLDGQPLVEIEWAEEDALPFPLCISAVGPAPECELREDISVARGNVVLVDHGRRIEAEDLGVVPARVTRQRCEGEGRPSDIEILPALFRPVLQRAPLTFRQPLPANGPASRLLTQDPRQALPQIGLISTPELVGPFSADALKDPAGLARELRGGAGQPVSQYLRDRISSESRDLLDEYDGAGPPSETLVNGLVDELNRALRDGGLYTADRFEGLRLTEETRRLVEYEPRDERLVGLLNRWLLEEAYPDEIMRSRRLCWRWTPQRDLLGSHGQDRHVVVEMDNDGRAHLRFGDGELGCMPEASTRFTAAYRVGNGPAGNVGAGAISHIVLRTTRLSGITLQPRNPLPAQGGVAPQPLAQVKLFAPYGFRTELQRAITADDYAHIVLRDFTDQVQRAAATLRWTGSWYEALVAVDPLGGVEASQGMLDQIERHLHRYRRMGHDVVVMPAHYVPLDIEMTVCVLPDHLRGHVKAALLDVFSNRIQPDGQLGFFHPDNLTFGEGVTLSRLVAVAQAVPGVESVIVTKLERRYEGPNGEIESGLLRLAPFEIARLDNDPSFPEHGRLTLNMRGGR